MEVKRTIAAYCSLVRFIVGVLIVFLPALLFAQQPVKYIVKQGKMFIEISKDVSDASLDSFITKFDLEDLYLRDFIKKNKSDSWPLSQL